MEYASADLTLRERYKVLTSFVLPRPIAWVTTIGPTCVVNAAPWHPWRHFIIGATGALELTDALGRLCRPMLSRASAQTPVRPPQRHFGTRSRAKVVCVVDFKR